jgi:hypothetical protein
MTMAEPARSELRHALDAAHSARRDGDVESSWRDLERAHILSQPWALAHVTVHAVMLSTAIAKRDAREAVGQMARLVVAGPGSLAGRSPEGNSGRARVSMFAPMPIPADLERILSDSR